MNNVAYRRWYVGGNRARMFLITWGGWVSSDSSSHTHPVVRHVTILL